MSFKSQKKFMINYGVQISYSMDQLTDLSLLMTGLRLIKRDFETKDKKFRKLYPKLKDMFKTLIELYLKNNIV